MEYNLQLQTVSRPGEVLHGPLGVINYIRRPVPDPGRGDGIPEALMDYFKILEHELDQARM